MTATWQRADLVPLAQRLRYVHLFRLLAIAAAVSWAAVSPVAQVARVGVAELGALAAYLVAALVAGVVVDRAASSSRWVFGAMLLLDALALTVLMHLHGGLDSPLRYLALLQLVLVTLVASHRTGLKLAIWHSLLLLIRHESIQVELLTDPAGPTVAWTLASHLGVLWLTVLVAAAASAVNEREILRRRYDLDALARMAVRLEDADSPHEVASVLVDHVTDTFDSPRGALIAVRGGEPLAIAGRGLQPVGRTGALTGVLARVVEEGRTLLVSHLGSEEGWLAEQLPDATHLVIVPLASEGEVQDVLVLERGRRGGDRIEQRVVSTLERFTSQGALALRNARLHAELVRLAQTDGLTGVANRTAFDRALRAELSRASRHDGWVSLVMCDIDFFKRVNDVHGHQVGDAALTWVAQQLQLGCREYDIVARYGGEEFAIVMPATRPEDAATVAERLRSAIEVGDGPTAVTASLGVAGFRGLDDAAGLVRAADEALYAAKRGGRNQVRAAAHTIDVRQEVRA